MKAKIPFYLFIVLIFLLAACASPVPASEVAKELATPTEAFTATEVPSTATATATAPSRPLSNLSADPQRKEFQAEDGKNLVGYYYPSKYAEAPIMILMHWAGGDLTDWCEIATWLQNRRDENPANPERCANAGSGLPAGMSTPWLDSTWFPPMAPEVSFAVFAFDFRDYGESEKGLGSPSNWAKDAKAAFVTAAGLDSTWFPPMAPEVSFAAFAFDFRDYGESEKGLGSPSNWAKDAKAAFVTAAELEGVDATRMASMGASIGADGAPDGCVLYNQEAGSGCVGAFSLSPGNYLGMDFAAVVRDLASTPVWCLAGELDGGSAPVCDGASGERYRSVVYPGIDLHGMSLITPDLEPQPLILTQDFMELVFGEIVK